MQQAKIGGTSCKQETEEKYIQYFRQQAVQEFMGSSLQYTY
jgi:hypothetical protein